MRTIEKGVGMRSDRTRRKLLDQLEAQGITNQRVLGAMDSIPRHFFIEESISHLAYENQALPIGKRQTISQPYVVALMSQAVLDVPNVAKVLEIGTGCGYQTAILSELVEQVYSVERIESLSLAARSRLRRLGIQNARLKHCDGLEGWEEHAPYDVIVVTAATRNVPSSLEKQVNENGRIVIPLGRSGRQDLVALDLVDGAWRTTKLETVVFVPLVQGTTT